MPKYKLHPYSGEIECVTMTAKLKGNLKSRAGDLKKAAESIFSHNCQMSTDKRDGYRISGSRSRTLK